MADATTDPGHKDGQQNSDDVSRAYVQFQDLLDKHMPNQTSGLHNQANRVGSKGNLWP